MPISEWADPMIAKFIGKIHNILTLKISQKTAILIMVLWIIYIASIVLVGDLAHKAGYEKGVIDRPCEVFTLKFIEPNEHQLIVQDELHRT